MLFLQKMLFAFMVFLFFATLIVLIIGVVGLFLLGFNIFTVSFTAGGLALFGLLFIVLPRLKKRTNEPRHGTAKAKGDFEELSAVFRDRPRLFKAKTHLMVHKGAAYLSCLLLLVSILVVIIFIVCDMFGVAWLAILIGAAIIVLFAFSVRPLFSAVSHNGVLCQRCHFPDFFEMLDDISGSTDTHKVDYVSITEHGECTVIYGKNSLLSTNAGLYVDIRLLLYSSKSELAALITNAMLLAEKKKKSSLMRLENKREYWVAVQKASLSKGRLSKTLLSRFAQNHVSKLYEYTSILSKPDTAIADAETMAVIKKSALADALIKKELICENLWVDPYSIPLNAFCSPALPEDYYDWTREWHLGRIESIVEPWMNLLITPEADDYSLLSAVKERLDDLQVDAEKTSLTFCAEERSPCVDPVLRFVLELKAELLSHEWNERHEQWKATDETANMQATDSHQLLEKVDALLELGETERAEEHLTELCESGDPPPAAYLRLGQIRLEKNNADGIKDLIRIIDSDTIEAGMALYRLQAYKEKHPEMADAIFEDWLDEAQERYNNLQSEMDEIRTTDVFMPTAPDPDLHGRIIAALKQKPGLEKAYLVRKALSYASFDYYVLAVAHGLFVSRKDIQSNIWDLHSTLSQDNVRITVFDVTSNPLFWKPLALVPDSLIYEKEGAGRG